MNIKPEKLLIRKYQCRTIVNTLFLSGLSLLASTCLCVNVHAEEPVKDLGDNYPLIPATGLIAALIQEDWEGTGQFLKSGLTCMAVTQGLKYTIDETRPNGSGHMSFPSGHTSASFFGASFLQRRYGWKYGTPAYLAATYVGWSRIENNAHYVHDVLAGAAIGVVSTYLFTTPLTDKIDIAPFVGEDSIGLGLSFRF